MLEVLICSISLPWIAEPQNVVNRNKKQECIKHINSCKARLIVDVNAACTCTGKCITADNVWTVHNVLHILHTNTNQTRHQAMHTSKTVTSLIFEHSCQSTQLW